MNLAGLGNNESRLARKNNPVVEQGDESDVKDNDERRPHIG